MFNKTLLASSIFATALSVSVCTFAAEPEVTPYRPGAGRKAVLSSPGYFELEGGYEFSKDAGQRNEFFSLLLKYGLNENLGLLVGVFPYISQFGTTGSGDASVGLKFIKKFSENTAAGMQLVATLPTGTNGFGTDRSIVTLRGLLGVDYSGFHSDFNLGWVRREDLEGSARNHYRWSANIGRPIYGPVYGMIELSGARYSTSKDTQVLASLSYAVNKRLVLDSYVARNQSGDAHYNHAGVGFTYLFAK